MALCRRIFAAVLLATVAVSGSFAQQNDAIVPVPREGTWMKRHESFNERVKQGNVDLIFIGDSITQGWENAGKKVWDEYYGKRNAVNLGIGGDRTQHVLWRLDHGNIDGINPKLAVLMIGTNNSSTQHVRADRRRSKADRREASRKAAEHEGACARDFSAGSESQCG